MGKVIKKSKHHGKDAREKQVVFKKINPEKIENKKIVNNDNNKTTKNAQ